MSMEMPMNVVDITCEYKGSEESRQLFDSVCAAAVWFAHEVRRNLPACLEAEEAFDRVTAQVALLFADWELKTPNDPEETDGGDPDCRYGVSVETIPGLAEAKANARKVDENAGVVKRKAKKEAKS